MIIPVNNIQGIREIITDILGSRVGRLNLTEPYESNSLVIWSMAVGVPYLVYIFSRHATLYQKSA